MKMVLKLLRRTPVRRVPISKCLPFLGLVPYIWLIIYLSVSSSTNSMAFAKTLPTLYEHFTGAGVTRGLSANQSYFTLNNKNITIYSGAIHYFRVPKPYWRDRLKKLRASGLNTVETYIPWNLHEPEPGTFDFGNGTFEMSEFIDVKYFLELAKEEDLFVIVRPGPYICTEWEFGGMPSWLLKDKEIIVRTSQTNFMKPVTRYFNALLPIIASQQFTKGGSVIAVQVENEYGSTYKKNVFVPDKQYLEELRQLMIQNGIVELLFTSDSPTMSGTLGTLPEYFLQTANFASNPKKEFDKLKELQTNKPTMAMEYWAGWFDHWSESHNTVGVGAVALVLYQILNYTASVNIYMFHGGTSFGFMNGANIAGGATDNRGYQPDTTSYDYDAPLTEAGDYTEKYSIIKDLIAKFNTVPVATPVTPSVTIRTAFPTVSTTSQLTINEVMTQVPTVFRNNQVISMEQLPINNGAGQSYGYIVYSKKNLNIRADSVLKIAGRVCDTVMVLINGRLVSNPLTSAADLNGFGYWRLKDSTLLLTSEDLIDATLDLVVENWGRNNFGWIAQFQQYKGLWQGGIFIDDIELRDWEITPLEFKKNWNNALTGWHSVTQVSTPALYKFVMNIATPQDTFIDMRQWTKGIVMVNGFVLGRYAMIGPQQTLYFPAPLQKQGENEIVVFEHFIPAGQLTFSEDQIFHTPSKKMSPSVETVH